MLNFSFCKVAEERKLAEEATALLAAEIAEGREREKETRKEIETLRENEKQLEAQRRQEREVGKHGMNVEHPSAEDCALNVISSRWRDRDAMQERLR